MQTLGNLINNEAVAGRSERHATVYNPATGEPRLYVSLSSADETREAIAAAQAAFDGWSKTPPLVRARVMFRFKELLERRRDDVARLITSEHGKVFSDAQGEVTRGLEVVEFACGIPHLLKGEFSSNVGRDIDSNSLMQPLGVCAGITPFNFPAMVPLWMLPVAIACGNTFVLKPSEKDPSATMLLGELLAEAGLPAGVLNIVNGDKEAVDVLLTDERVQSVSFVGSTPIAEYIYATASAHGKRCQALGGAKNHMVVMPDADPQQVVRLADGRGLTALPASAAWRFPWRCALVTRWLTSWSRCSKAKSARCVPARVWASSPEPHMGPGLVTARAPAEGQRLYRIWAWKRVRRWSATVAASRSRAMRTASMSARRCSTGSRRACTSTARKSSARCWRWYG